MKNTKNQPATHEYTQNRRKNEYANGRTYSEPATLPDMGVHYSLSDYISDLRISGQWDKMVEYVLYSTEKSQKIKLEKLKTIIGQFILELKTPNPALTIDAFSYITKLFNPHSLRDYGNRNRMSHEGFNKHVEKLLRRFPEINRTTHHATPTPSDLEAPKSISPYINELKKADKWEDMVDHICISSGKPQEINIGVLSSMLTDFFIELHKPDQQLTIDTLSCVLGLHILESRSIEDYARRNNIGEGEFMLGVKTLGHRFSLILHVFNSNES